MKKEENLGVRDRKGNQEQERVKEEVAATKENQELAVRGKHQDNDSEIQQAELKDKEEDVKAEVKPVAAIKIPTGQTKSTDDKPIIIPQSGTTPIPANPIESKPITTPQSGTTPLQSNPIESKPITTPQSGTTPIPANPIESKPITIPQSGTTPIPANPVESKPVTTSHVSTPQKQVEVKQVNQQQNKNIPKVNNQQHVKEGADIKKVNAKAQTQQEALKKCKSKRNHKN